MIVSKMTEAAGMAAFLMEESVQAVGMGAYLLYTSGDWRALDEYLEHFDTVVTAAEDGGVGLANLNPLIGGVALIYFDSARIQVNGMVKALRAQIRKQARKSDISVTEEMTNEQILDAIDVAEAEKIAERIELEEKYGEFRLSSTPGSAEIWLDGKNTELLTPETFKLLEARDYDIELRHYSATREVWDIYVFTTTITAGRKKEIHVRIPPTITTEEEEKEKAEWGQLHLLSTPTSAQIWLEGVDTGKLTPEVFKEMAPGTYTIALKSYSRKLDVWDEYSFDVEITKGERLELKVNIPGKALDAIRESLEKDETETTKYGPFVKALVTGEYAIDGDTFITTTGEHVRILGIDAPELGRPWADLAKENVAMLTEDKKLTLRIQTFLPIDKYGRTLAICTSYKGNIALLQLSAGLARAFIADDATYDPTRYLEAERIAKERRIGIWSEMP